MKFSMGRHCSNPIKFNFTFKFTCNVWKW